MPVNFPALQTTDLSVELGGLPVLRGITLTALPGEAIALLGGNGSGKSTLVRAILGLVPSRRGEVELLGTPLRRFSAWSRIGYVPQRSAAGLAGATVREVVASGRLSRRRVFRPLNATDRAAVTDALAATDVADLAGAEMARLSGGQQQRVLVARGLVADCDLLILDEPLAGVDLAHQEQIADVLATRKAAGVAVVVVLHEVGSLAATLDRAVVLREGRVVHDGDLGTVLEAGYGRHEHEVPVNERPLLPGLVTGGQAER